MCSKWDARFLSLAEHVAQWSKDPSTKVGAVIVDDKRRVVGVGYNGFARGVKDTDERLQNRDVKYKLVVHAESNALDNAAYTEGCTLYCTFFPCPQCAARIIQKGIRRVVALANPSDERWAEEQKFSKQQFDDAGVIYGSPII
jgi:dCMP deaminase